LVASPFESVRTTTSRPGSSDHGESSIRDGRQVPVGPLSRRRFAPETEGSLRPELDPSIAADLLWTMTSLRMWEDLILERGWSPEQYQVYVTNVSIGALTSSRSE